MRKLVLTLFILLYSFGQALAQRFPITVIPQVNPPAPVNFYNYADGTTINSPLRVQFLLSDITISREQIRLKVSFEGNGIAFESRDVVVGAPTLLIDGGIPLVLTNAELAPYFEFQNLQGINPNIYSRTIPEGSYQFCFEVFDFTTGNRLSSKTCASTYIFKNEPPILNLPFDGVNIEPKEVDNIVFQWTPRHINVSNVEYELSIVEIWDDFVDPQTAFLSLPPVFETTTRSTSFVYGPTQPLLLPEKRYAWRVRAKALQGAEEVGLFRNEGNSEIFWFSRTSPCTVPINVYAEPKGISKINVFWDEDPSVYTEYTIAYREANKPNAEWFTMRTNSGWATVWDLKPGTTYEYKVKGKCKYQYGLFSEIQEITTATAQDETANYNCGIVPDAIAITNREPHPNLQIGDRITAGDFVMTITELDSNNSGRITGRGYVKVPYFKFARFGVKFDNVLVNTDNQLAEGEIVTLYDPAFGEGEGMTVDVDLDIVEMITGDQGELSSAEVDFVIADIKPDENNAWVITGTNGEQAIVPGGQDVVIRDESGTAWTIGEDGTISQEQVADGGPVTEESTAGLTNGDVSEISATGVRIDFEKSGFYAFDEMPNNVKEQLGSKYKSLTMVNGEVYHMPYKVISDIKGEDKIRAKATFSDSNITKEDIVFKTKEGIEVSAEWSGDIATLSLKKKSDYLIEEILATVKPKDSTEKYKIAGAFNLVHLGKPEMYAINLVIVPVNNANVNTRVRENINAIYNKAGVNFKITTGDRLQIPESVWDIDKSDQIVNAGESGVLNYYSKEEKAIHEYFKTQTNYNEQTYYLFVTDLKAINSDTKEELEGFMPLKGQFGFVFQKSKNQSTTIAHELGHGVFGLEHPFVEYKTPEKSTEFLMDYKGGTVFNHMDWKKIHAPGFKLYWFQGDEDGESGTINNIEGLEDFKNENGTYTFLAPSGKPITLPSNLKSITFSVGDDTSCDEKFQLFPFGTLIGFEIEDKGRYNAISVCGKNEFVGFQNGSNEKFIDNYTNDSIDKVIVGFPAINGRNIIYKIGQIEVSPVQKIDAYTAKGVLNEYDFLVDELSTISKYNEIYANFDPKFDEDVIQFIYDHIDKEGYDGNAFYDNDAYVFIHATQLQKNAILKNCFKTGVPGQLLKFITKYTYVYGHKYSSKPELIPVQAFSSYHEEGLKKSNKDNLKALINHWKQYDINYYPIISKAVKEFELPKEVTAEEIIDLFMDSDVNNDPLSDNWDCFWDKIDIEDKKQIIKTFAEDGFLFKGYYDLTSSSEHVLLKIFTTTSDDKDKKVLLEFINNYEYLNYILTSLDYNSSDIYRFIAIISDWVIKLNPEKYNSLSEINRIKEEYKFVVSEENYGEIPYKEYETELFELYGTDWVNSGVDRFSSFEANLKNNNGSVIINIKDLVAIGDTVKKGAIFKKEFDPFAPVLIHLNDDIYAKYNSSLVAGEYYMVPSIFLLWLDKSRDSELNERALRVGLDVLAIALAPYTAGGSTAFLVIEVSAAVTDIVITINQDEFIEQFGQKSLVIWDGVYFLWNVYGLVRSLGGSNFLKFESKTVKGELQISSFTLDMSKARKFADELINNGTTAQKLDFIAGIDKLIEAIKLGKADRIANITKVYEDLLTFRIRTLSSLEKASDGFDFGVKNGYLIINNVDNNYPALSKIDIVDNKLTLTDNARWLPNSVTQVNKIGQFRQIGYLENGANKTATIDVVADANNPSQFYLKKSISVSNPVRYKFEEEGYKYIVKIEERENGNKKLFFHYLQKGDEGELEKIGDSRFVESTKTLVNNFEVPEKLRGKGASKRMYDEVFKRDIQRIESKFFDDSDNYAAFIKAFDPKKQNKVEAVLSTPSGKVLGKDWTPENINIGDYKVSVEWVRKTKPKSGQYQFEKEGYVYTLKEEKGIDGAKEFTHYLQKEGEDIIEVGKSSIVEKHLSNNFDIPDKIKSKGVSKAIYEKLLKEDIETIGGLYLSESDTYKAFMNVYDTNKNNGVDAALATPQAKVLGKDWEPKNIEIDGYYSVHLVWIKKSGTNATGVVNREIDLSKPFSTADIFEGHSSKTLLLGEGNFSFTKSIITSNPSKKEDVIATTIESLDEVTSKYANASSNISYIKSSGVEVLHNIDATNLPVPSQKYGNIIFNFPFKSVPRPQQTVVNSKLMKDFIKSAEKVVEKGGLVFITQKKYWATRFKLAILADGTSFKLVGNKEFDQNLFEGYQHRMTDADQSSNLENVITYIFEKQ
ncbi:Rossmann-like fold-containing protein [Aquimarina sp. AU119]|uniref:Rossmann-like fold-containing protein n=1 Tax=Aquimarina sp. AU119 TaxID=2108528 RepID=UPI000D695DBD|nr:Rossmann-like fold-containing protein [Aquimarina sp. AU119]